MKGECDICGTKLKDGEDNWCAKCNPSMDTFDNEPTEEATDGEGSAIDDDSGEED